MAVEPSCSVEGDDCSKPGGRITTGLCRRHYYKLRTYGDELHPDPEPAPEVCRINDDECNKTSKIARGLCTLHYWREREYGDPLRGPDEWPTVCSINDESCSPAGGPITKGLCQKHYKLSRRETLGVCQVPDCDKWVATGGYCDGHYRRSRLYGAPEEGILTFSGLGAKFIRKAVSYEGDECLEWPYARFNTGYGQAKWEGVTYPAHRIVLILATGGPPDPKMLACHKPVICHNPPCCNPRHLYWGTSQDNGADMAIDGTSTRGERNAKAKLTEAQVYAIRADPRPDDVIALDYPVTASTIRQIKNRVTWRHLPEIPLAA